jgi:phage terminase large subunit-like protein
MQLISTGVAVLVRKDALLRFRQTLNAAVPWEKPGLSRSERVTAFLQDLTISTGKDAGKKLKLRPFQRQFVEQVYADQRLVRTAVLSCARKQGKTFLAAGLALCHLCGPEREPHGQVLSCANDRFQAGQIFHAMYAMIVAHPWLAPASRFSTFTSKFTICRPARNMRP